MRNGKDASSNRKAGVAPAASKSITDETERVARNLKMGLDRVEKTITEHYGEQVLNQVKAGFSVAATLALADNRQPVTLIFVGPSGSSKSLTCSMVTPDNDHATLRDYIFRNDKFTPKSFVSHAANVKAERLHEIDLLPKIENRILVTKELACLFRGNSDDLQENFSILIAVLDGKGYVSSSGIRGTRGYDRDINFAWIGATTPLSNEVHRLMAQLGTRLVFYNTAQKDRDIDDLLKFARRTSNSGIESECRSVCNDFLLDLFERHPRKTVVEDWFEFPEDLLLDLVRFAKLMCYLRAGFSMKEERNGGMRYSQPEREVEYRAITILKNLAYGSALIHGRRQVGEFDLQQIQHIAYSSMPEQRRLVFDAVKNNEGQADVNDICATVGMSKPTALHYMEELSHLGVCSFSVGGFDGSPSSIRLLNDWSWVVSEQELMPEAVKPNGGVHAF